jgi:hypothetical protein
VLAGRGDHAAPDLIELDRFEQGFEIALAEALIALALDDLEEDRPDHVLGEDLQQQALARLGDPSIRMRRSRIACTSCAWPGMRPSIMS